MNTPRISADVRAFMLKLRAHIAKHNAEILQDIVIQAGHIPEGIQAAIPEALPYGKIPAHIRA